MAAQTLFLAVSLTSLSRSNWIGLAFGQLAVFAVYFLRSKNLKAFFWPAACFFASFVLAVLLVGATVKFPFPAAMSNFNPSDLAERAGETASEAGVASRWSLLPKLFEKIKAAPVLGGGFGSTVTYRSSDPRVLAANPSGEYTTYAFEWGWLDIWLKTGLFGALAYAALLFVIASAGIDSYLKAKAAPSFAGLVKIFGSVGLAVLSAVSFFSPYLNHPLGIGIIMLAALSALLPD
jgi:O-antigen ligase